MSKTSVILSVLMTVALAVLIAPGILAINRGKVLRNIALWLAIFTGLMLVYRNFGPDSKHALFSLPPSMVREEPRDIPPEKTDGDKTGDDKTTDDKTDGSKGFTPPGE